MQIYFLSNFFRREFFCSMCSMVIFFFVWYLDVEYNDFTFFLGAGILMAMVLFLNFKFFFHRDKTNFVVFFPDERMNNFAFLSSRKV